MMSLHTPSPLRWPARLALYAAAALALAACGSEHKPDAAQAGARASAAANAAPAITAGPQPTTVPAGSAASFEVGASGEALRYQWHRNGEPLPRATERRYTTPNTLTTDNGARYSVTVHNAHGEVASEAATLTVTEAVNWN